MKKLRMIIIFLITIIGAMLALNASEVLATSASTRTLNVRGARRGRNFVYNTEIIRLSKYLM